MMTPLAVSTAPAAAAAAAAGGGLREPQLRHTRRQAPRAVAVQAELKSKLCATSFFSLYSLEGCNQALSQKLWGNWI
jgi:hypothetical protein